MIHGIDILLHGEPDETVSNVLVGEPSMKDFPIYGGAISAYTLAIPKGDTHVWTDRIVEFFGCKFRTVGVIEQGIEENVPTCWHTKIHAEQLITTGSCTVYEKGTFRRHFFEDVLFHDLRSEMIQRDGVQKQGDVSLYIYSVSTGDGYTPQVGDYIVGGECPFTFNAASQKSISESLSAFRKAYPNYATIHRVSRKVCGMLPDYEIAAR